MSDLADKIEHCIKKGFPSHRYKREHYIFYQNTQLFFDFFMPELRVLIEVQGQQHYAFNKFYHQHKDKFDDQVYRDKLKTQFAAELKYKLLQISYKEVGELTPASFRVKVIEAL